jgi:DNA-binding transcriptional LysR family regulator
VDLTDFHLFQLIAQHGSLSGAAQHVDRSVAAVSARLKRIELSVRALSREVRLLLKERIQALA